MDYQNGLDDIIMLNDHIDTKKTVESDPQSFLSFTCFNNIVDIPLSRLTVTGLGHSKKGFL